MNYKELGKRAKITHEVFVVRESAAGLSMSLDNRFPRPVPAHPSRRLASRRQEKPDNGPSLKERRREEREAARIETLEGNAPYEPDERYSHLTYQERSFE